MIDERPLCRVVRLHAFRCGGVEGLRRKRLDATADGQLDLSDGVAIVAHLFLGDEEPICLDSADSNDDDKLDLSDTVFVLNHLFVGGSAPPSPGPPGGDCVRDSGDGLGCSSYPPCGD